MECLARDLGCLSTSSSLYLRKIMRKPRGIGAEVKCSADAETGLMLHLEIQGGKRSSTGFSYTETMQLHCALDMRLVEPWLDQGRTIIGDSAFSSYYTCVELLRRSAFFMGTVKTATKQYPKEYLKYWANSDIKRGDRIVLTSHADVEEAPDARSIAIGWGDTKVKTFIASCGTTLPAQPHVVQRSKVVIDENKRTKIYNVVTERPQCLTC